MPLFVYFACMAGVFGARRLRAAHDDYDRRTRGARHRKDHR
jgi:hypothetical protein